MKAFIVLAVVLVTSTGAATAVVPTVEAGASIEVASFAGAVGALA